MNLHAARLQAQVPVVDAAAKLAADAGLPLVIEGFRSFGSTAAACAHVHLKVGTGV